MEGFRRHDLVWLDPDTDVKTLLVSDEHADMARNWIQQSWPLVVARQPDEAARQAGLLQLGITLPSSPARTRVALRVSQATIISYSRPLLLKDAIAYAPPAWREHLSAVSEICAAHAVEARVYGSLSTQAFTGKNYLDAASDVDVLFECSKKTTLQKLLDELQALEMEPLKIDGEILTLSGWAVAWRELATALQKNTSVILLAKSYSEARLLRLDQLFSQQLSAAA
ncbi:MAG TPA: malonate decarboxylase holo-[acyl-carrier-protein] synthase [Gallionellaceae bacterium]|nr:malonate decarboxylase holo-[acyl-carrier-protein] synthase [Gallionellaceae bacterium]